MTFKGEIMTEIEMYCTTVHPDNKKELLNVILYRVEKLIDEKIDSYENISLNDTIIKTDCLRELKKELSK
jgi:hypothetical protein